VTHSTENRLLQLKYKTNFLRCSYAALLPHRLFRTACRRTYGHLHRCSCSYVGSRLSFSAFSGPKTLYVTFT